MPPIREGRLRHRLGPLLSPLGGMFCGLAYLVPLNVSVASLLNPLEFFVASPPVDIDVVNLV